MAEAETEAEGPPRRKDHSGWDSVAERLLEQNFLLTALELYTESLETGREISRLRDFFSNPGNFGPTQPQQLTGLVRSASVSTFDSLDVSRYSDDGNDPGDDRLAVLEFELRKAKETIASLRGSLTHAAVVSIGRSRRQSIVGYSAENDQVPRDASGPAAVEVAKPHEVRALNFLTNQFLLKTGMRLASITFSDEVEAQDLESWDSVGLDTPQPPELLQLYRNYSRHVASNFTVLQENERLASELSSLEAELIALRRENEKSQARIRDLEKRRSLQTPAIAISSDLGSSRHAAMVEPIAEVPSNTSIGVQSSVTIEGDSLVAGSQDAGTAKDVSTSNSAFDSQVASQTTGGNEHVAASQSSDSIVRGAMERNDSQRTASQSEVAGILERPLSLRNSRSMSTAFRQALLASSQTNTESRLAKEVTKLMSGGQDCVVVLGRALPHIVPNVLLNKRDELIPLLLCAATQHPEERDRDQLLNFLFNLIKKPNAEQRQMIITGCVAFAKHNGPVRLEAELLPQCWEQISHKYAERRLLVAESCGALAPYLPTELRSSLLLSMLKQMLSDDKSEDVRAAVTRTLGLVVAFIDDADKYNQCYDLLVSTLSDSEKVVVDAARHVFLPALAAWAYEMQVLEPRLLACLLAQINSRVTKVSNSLSGQDDEEKVLRQEESLVLWILTYEALLTWQVASVLQGGPFVNDQCPDIENEGTALYRPQESSEPLLDLAIIIGCSDDVIRLRALFEQYTSEESWELWSEVKWLLADFLPKVTDFLIQLDVGLSKAVSSFTQLLTALCRLLGRSFVNSRIRPFFSTILSPETPTDRPSSARVAALCSALLPCFVCGVLNCFPEDQALLTSTLHKLLCFMALNVLPMESMQITFLMLAEDKELHVPLVDVLWETLRSSTAQVRCATASLLELLIKDVDETLVASRFVPALVTLASDDDMAVRVATVAGFGSLMECAKQKSLLEKAQVQLASFLDEPAYESEHAVQVEVVKTLGRCGPNAEPVFRDQFVLPRLHSLAERNNQSGNKTKRRDIAIELQEAFRTLSCCFIPADSVAEHLLPALRCLLTDVQDVDPDSTDAVKSLISEVESKKSSSDTGGGARQQQPVDQGAKTRLMRVLRRDSTQNVSATGQSAMSALGTQSPKATRDVRGFFRLNKQS